MAVVVPGGIAFRKTSSPSQTLFTKMRATFRGSIKVPADESPVRKVSILNTVLTGLNVRLRDANNSAAAITTTATFKIFALILPKRACLMPLKQRMSDFSSREVMFCGAKNRLRVIRGVGSAS